MINDVDEVVVVRRRSGVDVDTVPVVLSSLGNNFCNNTASDIRKRATDHHTRIWKLQITDVSFAIPPAHRKTHDNARHMCTV